MVGALRNRTKMKPNKQLIDEALWIALFAPAVVSVAVLFALRPVDVEAQTETSVHGTG
jgi:hypothetical protein